ncbi:MULTISPECIES: hypothetical protein [Paenibacillus]|uniref:Uncharacterized protein n=1 Tax=Paenibacillus vandeheii TaxID=3035917 RepID=A0ABT8JHU7_9BACL|nr:MULTISPECIES: hypothetical protein [Paenibacillus]KGP78391.1 hypothetical protein P363_0132260 [Paenibacillus sp. MAEPY1]KGP78434.1 hypothetical protein P364_0128775 [Paenibacillus sp. MAEPY2]MDN4604007.1 hypothetical protein [Paenibacillus vandeheii]
MSSLKSDPVIQDGNEVLLQLMESSLSDKVKINHICLNPITGEQLTFQDLVRIESFFNFVFLIHQDDVKDTPIIHPEFIRYPKTMGIYTVPKRLEPTFNGRKWSRYVELEGMEYRAAENNVRAKHAFKEYTNVNLTDAKRRNRLYGYTVAHIFGGADNPLLFSAGFNLALINDGFAKYTDEQHLDPLIYWALTSAAFLLHKTTIHSHINLKSLPFVGPLIPKIQDGKYQKQKHRIQFQVVQPLNFWFPVNVVKRNDQSYTVLLVTPE